MFKYKLSLYFRHAQKQQKRVLEFNTECYNSVYDNNTTYRYR